MRWLERWRSPAPQMSEEMAALQDRARALRWETLFTSGAGDPQIRELESLNRAIEELRAREASQAAAG